jgi:hypothetical protein
MDVAGDIRRDIGEHLQCGKLESPATAPLSMLCRLQLVHEASPCRFRRAELVASSIALPCA